MAALNHRAVCTFLPHIEAPTTYLSYPYQEAFSRYADQSCMEWDINVNAAFTVLALLGPPPSGAANEAVVPMHVELALEYDSAEDGRSHYTQNYLSWKPSANELVWTRFALGKHILDLAGVIGYNSDWHVLITGVITNMYALIWITSRPVISIFLGGCFLLVCYLSSCHHNMRQTCGLSCWLIVNFELTLWGLTSLIFHRQIGGTDNEANALAERDALGVNRIVFAMFTLAGMNLSCFLWVASRNRSHKIL